MNKELLEKILLKLSKKRPVFHQEADFQFALAGEIRKELKNAKIRLEYPVAIEKDGKKKNEYVDIIVTVDDKVYPIELKYKTKKLDITIDDEDFYLKSHAAHDLGNYDSLKDIGRIEKFVANNKCEAGFVIWLSNDKPRWINPILEATSLTSAQRANGVEVKLHEGLGEGSTRGRTAPILLNSDYKDEIKWRTYSFCDSERPASELKYMLLEIKKG